MKRHFCVKCGKETSTFFKISKVDCDHKDPWLFPSIFSGTAANTIVTTSNSSSTSGAVSGNVYSYWQNVTACSSSVTMPLISVINNMNEGENIIIELCSECMKEMTADILVVQTL